MSTENTAVAENEIILTPEDIIFTFADTLANVLGKDEQPDPKRALEVMMFLTAMAKENPKIARKLFSEKMTNEVVNIAQKFNKKGMGITDIMTVASQLKTAYEQA